MDGFFFDQSASSDGLDIRLVEGDVSIGDSRYRTNRHGGEPLGLGTTIRNPLRGCDASLKHFVWQTPRMRCMKLLIKSC
jgi:hypothetical protein